jgi:membrane-bound lytic murein transglycosylase A
MNHGYLAMLLVVTTASWSVTALAKSSVFWENLTVSKTVHLKKHIKKNRSRTRWAASRGSKITARYQEKIKKTAPKTKEAKTKKARSCSRVKQAQQLPKNCVKKTRLTRSGIVSQIKYLKSLHARKNAKVRYANYQNVGNRDLLGTARSLLNWFDRGGTISDNFDLHRLGVSTEKVKYTGYFTPSLSARKYPNNEYRFPIYGAPKNGHFPTRGEIFNGVLRGKGLEIAWTNDPMAYYEIQVQGSGSLSYPNGKVLQLHFAGKSPAKFIAISRYMQKKGYIKRPSASLVKNWMKKNPNRVEEVLAANPRFVFFSLSKRGRSQKTASGRPLIAGHTVAVDTRQIPFGSVLLAELPIRNAKGKVTRKEWRLLFPQDRGGDIKGTKRLDLYTGRGDRAKRLTRAVTGMGRAYLLTNKTARSRSRIRTAAR